MGETLEEAMEKEKVPENKIVTKPTPMKKDETMDLECDGDMCYPKFF